MSIKLMNTNQNHESGVKVLIYGPSGVGKTTLIGTAPKPIIISAEKKLRSLNGKDIPVIIVESYEDMQEAYTYIKEHLTEFETVCIDSISEIAEVILNSEKKAAKDPRQAYGALQDKMGEVIRAYRDFEGVNVYFIAKCEKLQDDTGKILYGASMPGNKLGQSLPYFFDEVLALRAEKDADGKTIHMLQTGTDGIWSAKDCSNNLSAWEDANLTEIFNKIKGV